MHKEILTKEQTNLLPLLKLFSKEYYLAGGTAIALYIGHRRSIDFDLFTDKPIKRKNIRNNIEKLNLTLQTVLYEAFDQLHLIINSVKVTFFNYPYKIEPMEQLLTEKNNNIIKIPSLLDLSAMKAFTLGGRAKWKDYVDLYFILKNYFTLEEITNRAKDIFGNYFNEKLFREQLGYFDDIDYTESIEFINDKISDEEIKNFLMKQSIKIL